MADSAANPDEYTNLWKELYANQTTSWHLTEKNPTLVKYENRLLEGRKDGKMTILVPFCGKSVDMKHFYLAGHTVFGIDCCIEAIIGFFQEQELEYDKVPMSNGKDYYYATKDRRLILLHTNFYTLDDEMINGKIDAVWDRGGFVAIDGVEQELYIKTIRKLMADDFRYLLLVVEYDKSQLNSFPYPQPEEKVRKFYDWATVEKLASWPMSEKRSPRLSKLDVNEAAYLITPKKN